MRFGIIGAGMIADFHRRAIEEVEGAELVAVYNKTEKSAQEFSEEHHIPWFDNIEKMVREAGCEVVTIATPSGWHLEPSLEAMAAGAHVLSEKPMEITTDRVDQMIAAAQAAGVLLGGILQFRTGVAARKAKEIIESGRLGNLLVADAYIKYYRDQPYYDSGAWRGTWELDGGGATMNQGIHWVDLIRWLMGDPEWVYGLASTLGHQIDVEDVSHAIVKWKNGAQGVIEATTCAMPGIDTRIEIHGENGSILLEDTRLASVVIDGEEEYHEEKTESGGGYDKPTSISTEGHVRHIQDIMEAVTENPPPLVPGEEARKSVELITAIYQSSREGKRIEL